MSAAEVRDPADADAWALCDAARAAADTLDTRQRHMLVAVHDRDVSDDHRGIYWVGEHWERGPAVSEDDQAAIDDLIAAGLVEKHAWRLTELGDTVHDGLATGRWTP